MLDQDAPDAVRDKIFRAGLPVSAEVADVSPSLSGAGSAKDAGCCGNAASGANGAGSCGAVVVKVPFVHQVLGNMFLYPDKDEAPAIKDVVFRAYGDRIMRITTGGGADGALPDDAANPMLSFAADLKQTPLSVERVTANAANNCSEEGWAIKDSTGAKRAFIKTKQEKREIWSDLQPEPPLVFEVSVYPDGKTEVPFAKVTDGQGFKTHSLIHAEANPFFKAKTGKQVEVAAGTVEVHDILITPVEMAKRFKARAGFIPDGFIAGLKKEFPDGVPAQLVDDLVREHTDGSGNAVKLA